MGRTKVELTKEQAAELSAAWADVTEAFEAYMASSVAMSRLVDRLAADGVPAAAVAREMGMSRQSFAQRRTQGRWPTTSAL